MLTLQLDLGREMRGGQWQVLSLMRALKDDGILLARRKSPLLERARAEGLRAEAFSPISLARWQSRCDLVHAHDARSHLWTALLSLNNVIVSRRVAFPVKTSAISRWKYSKPRAFLAVSQFVRGQLIDAGVPAEEITVIYDGVSLPFTAASGTSILAVETNDPMKGGDLLREASAFGGFPVHFTTELDRDLSNAAIFVYLTRSEGLGSAALLAMAAGVPVVASNVGGLPEIVENGETGVLTENEPQAVSAAIRFALEHRDRLGRNARRRVQERFTLERMVRDTRAVYERLLP